jgi:hypothetical protein
MRSDVAAALLACLAAPACAERAVTPLPPPAARSQAELLAPDAFVSIADRDDRARALFREASRVMLHPRCVNCHPAGDTPAQGDSGQPHDPPVARGTSDEGVPALECRSCHQDTNSELARVPGAPKWHLAPIEMAWVGRTPATLCEQLKDRRRNGGKTLAEIVEHASHDPLVAWGWAPGHGRIPVPGTQAQFGALIAAWARDGAACPKDER